MTVVKVGALVEVTLHGEVTRTDGGAICLKLGEGRAATSCWIPTGATVTVLSEPRPSEVLLLSCGHAMSAERPASPSDRVYCWRCMCEQTLMAVGSVNW